MSYELFRIFRKFYIIYDTGHLFLMMMPLVFHHYNMLAPG